MRPKRSIEGWPFIILCFAPWVWGVASIAATLWRGLFG